MKVEIKGGLTDLMTTSNSRTGKGNKRINDFLEMKPFLHQLSEKGQGFFLPSSKDPKKEKRDVQYILNKYGQAIGKIFAVVAQEKAAEVKEDKERGIAAEPAKEPGIWIIMAGTQEAKEPEIPESQKDFFGDSLNVLDTKNAETAPEAEAAPEPEEVKAK